MQTWLAAALLVVLACASEGTGAAVGLSVATEYGPVVGHVSPTFAGVLEWQGVPFAAPPTGALRWRPPARAAAWTEPLVANRSGPGCPTLFGPLLKGAEDCLHLNVYVPPGTETTAPKPVMVFLHGGGWVIGDDIHGHSDDKDGQRGLYDGSRFAANHDVVVVAMNYRLSALGLLALDVLKDEAGTTGNYALQDQQAALHWVQSNIGAFGGDPKRVLLFGESAGAFSVCWHLVSPGSAGTFAAVLLESGNCDSQSFFRTYEHATNFSTGWAAHVGCDAAELAGPALAACLRALPLKAVMDSGVLAPAPGRLGSFGPGVFWPKLAPIMSWGAAIDGSPDGLVGVPAELLAAGHGNPVPVVMGTNGEEGSLFIPMMPVMVPGIGLPLDKHGSHDMLVHFFNETVYELALTYYPIESYKDEDARAVAVLTDFFFVCATRRLLRAMDAAQPGVPRFEYRFVYPIDTALGRIFGDAHSFELPYVFGFDTIVSPLDKPDDQTMINTIQYYWTNFAKTHNPSSPANASYPVWPAYTAATEETLLLDVPPSTTAKLGDQCHCDFWDKVEFTF